MRKTEYSIDTASINVRLDELIWRSAGFNEIMLIAIVVVILLSPVVRFLIISTISSSVKLKSRRAFGIKLSSKDQLKKSYEIEARAI